MVYSCAYFRDWSNSLEQAQRDKLDLICRKLRLRAGESLLDIGSGWGALLCHAAQHYGVSAHGVTLSQAQYDYAQAKIARLGLQDRVTVSLADYMTLEGRYDKIASIGMYEHVGIANYTAYFKKMHELLAQGGVFLNHGITRRAKRNIRNFGKISPSRRVILKYIFPGAELDHIGHTVQVMESCGFEIQDVEALRRHYARTCRLWHDRLTARREAGDRAGRAGALSHVGGLSRRRHRRLRIRAAARVPDGRDQAGRCALAAAADSRGSLPRRGPAAARSPRRCRGRLTSDASASVIDGGRMPRRPCRSRRAVQITTTRRTGKGDLTMYDRGLLRSGMLAGGLLLAGGVAAAEPQQVWQATGLDGPESGRPRCRRKA